MVRGSGDGLGVRGRGDHTVGLYLPLAPEHKEKEILHLLLYLENYLTFGRYIKHMKDHTMC